MHSRLGAGTLLFMNSNFVIATVASLLAFPALAETAAEPVAPAAAKLPLTLDIQGLRAPRGKLVVSIFADAKAFPGDPSKAIAKQEIDINQTEMQVSFKDLPAGEYAVALHHDENGDGKMSYNFVGMPKEGFGFSRNGKVIFGPPSFSDAKVTLSEEGTKAEIKMKYF
jgi:uncharacterized protein (DUF2141 family)